MSNSVKTPKGTTLPLISLKGKDYLMVGHRFVWFNEVENSFEIDTQFLLLTDEQTVCRAEVKVLDKDRNVVKKATATKRETKKDFSDHTEKAETSAVGRALAMLGYGTQFAIADLDEGNRLADSPVTNTKQSTVQEPKMSTPKADNIAPPGNKLSENAVSGSTQIPEQSMAAPASEAPAKTSYRKPTKRATTTETTQTVSNGADSDWN